MIFVGYFNYNLDQIDKEDTIQVASTNEVNIGDVQLVNSEPLDVCAIVSNENLEESVYTNENVVENVKSTDSKLQDNINTSEEDDYFEETRIERDRMYSEMLETYQDLVSSQETPSDQKAIAVQEISNITNIKNGIMIAENLIKNKGFEDVVILVNNGIVSVVVKTYTLNQEQVSKIQNIIERELKIEAKNINISNKF